MKKEVTLKYEYGNHWNKEWRVYYGNTLLLRTSNEAQAREAYERYKNNPPDFYKIPAEDAIEMWN